MSYFKVLGLIKEPFSTSPDPAFFFLSREHKAAFYRLQVAITLKRGLSVIIGDVGTGKTTLSRKLSQTLNADDDVVFRMVLNPRFKTERQFLAKLASLFHIAMPSRATGLDLIEAIERYLFQVGVEEKKTVVLLIDEAQILPDFALETLRILLNYETNEYKILQLVLVGQMELLPRISKMANFWDRIAMKYVINPLGEDEVREVVDYRLRQAGYSNAIPMFTNDGIKALCEQTQGYPRQLSRVCHNCLEYLVMHDLMTVDQRVVEKVMAMDVAPVFDAFDDDIVDVAEDKEPPTLAVM
jgi:general secretion pathway protein A